MGTLGVVRSWVRWLWLLGCSGCSVLGGGQTGDAPDGPSPTCWDVSRTELALEDETELGFSAEDVLALASGSREAPAVWNVGGALGEAVTATVTLSPKAAWFVDAEWAIAPSEGATTVPGKDACSSRVEVDATVGLELRGESNVMQATGDATFYATNSGVLRFGQWLDPEQVTGDPVRYDLGGVPQGYSVAGTATESGWTGFVVRYGKFLETGRVVSGGMAAWPADNDCTDPTFDTAVGYLPAGVPLFGVTPEAVVSSSAFHAPLRWDSGAATEIHVEVRSRGQSCLRKSCDTFSNCGHGPPGAYQASEDIDTPVVLEIRSADGSWAQDVEGSLSVEVDEGGRVLRRGASAWATFATPAALEEAWKIRVNYDGEMKLGLDLDISWDEAGAPTGHVLVSTTSQHMAKVRTCVECEGIELAKGTIGRP